MEIFDKNIDLERGRNTHGPNGDLRSFGETDSNYFPRSTRQQKPETVGSSAERASRRTIPHDATRFVAETTKPTQQTNKQTKQQKKGHDPPS